MSTYHIGITTRCGIRSQCWGSFGPCYRYYIGTREQQPTRPVIGLLAIAATATSFCQEIGLLTTRLVARSAGPSFHIWRYWVPNAMPTKAVGTLYPPIWALSPSGNRPHAEKRCRHGRMHASQHPALLFHPFCSKPVQAFQRRRAFYKLFSGFRSCKEPRSFMHPRKAGAHIDSTVTASHSLGGTIAEYGPNQ